MTIAFAKSFKVSGSTVVDILTRLAYLNNWYVATTSLQPTETDKAFAFCHYNNSAAYPTNTFDIHIQDERWHYEDAMLHLGAKFKSFTILRDPVQQFESMFSFMDMREFYNVTSFSEFVIKVGKGSARSGRLFDAFGRNQLSWTLGLEEANFDNLSAISQFIDGVKNQFDLVMISEKFDESLVLLKDLIKVPLEHLAYVSVNARSPKTKHRITEEEADILRKWLKADLILYEEFKRQLEEKINPWTKQQADDLRSINSKIVKFCKVNKKEEQRNVKPEERFGNYRRMITNIERSGLFCDRFGMLQKFKGEKAIKTADDMQRLFLNKRQPAKQP